MINEKTYQTEELKEFYITHTDKGFLITNLTAEEKKNALYKWLAEHDGEGKITQVLKNEAVNGD